MTAMKEEEDGNSAELDYMRMTHNDRTTGRMEQEEEGMDGRMENQQFKKRLHEGEKRRMRRRDDNTV